MHIGDWGARRCARCQAEQAAPKVRADAALFTCPACGYEWAVPRMPSDFEAAGIMKRAPRDRPDSDEAVFDAKSLDEE
ncbi:MAG TPA: hypothetical protein VL173_00070 [Vicinamibacterales bacterium]|jgi:hypothetical protein|nr:hypothetical protein [Vicinamibacterales bacterium]